MPVEEAVGVMVIAVCPTCSEIRYRSKIPIISPADCKPENFMAIDGNPAPWTDIPLCPVCTAVLTFSKETALDPAKRRAKPPTLAPTRAQGTETLFEVRPDEVVKDIDSPEVGVLLVVTNQRILRIRV